MLTQDPIIAQVQRVVTDRMQGQGAGHGMDHVLRVLHNARQLQSAAGGDRLTIELAALLHDVGDAKFHDGVERSGEFAREILAAFELPVEMIEHVAQICDQISFRKAVPADQLSWEAKIVQDADRLEALGAIGIVRTIEYGAICHQPFFASDNPTGKSGVKHFYDKLFKLRSLLHTPAAKAIAIQREQFMAIFLEQYFLETGCTNPFTEQLV